MRKSRRNNSFRTGAALLVVLFIVMTITVLSLGFLSKSDVELTCGENMVLRSQMDYLAESGLEHAKGLILNPQDVDSQYWAGITGLQLVPGSSDFYDVLVSPDTDASAPEPEKCNYIIDCNAYRIRGGERIGFSGLRAKLRLDPCITLWTGANTAILSGHVINGDVKCDGVLSSLNTINGDIFANSFSGSKTGQLKGVDDLSLLWPQISISSFISYYDMDVLISGSINSQSLGSINPVRICYRNGDLELAGNNEINGMLLVNGDLTISGNQNFITAAKNLPALYVAGDLIVDKDSDLNIDGLAVIDNNVLLNGDNDNLIITGGLFVQNTIYETTKDAAGNEHHGILIDAPQWQPSAGRYNGAVRFDSINDKIENYSIPASINGLSAITLSLWIKSDVIYQDRDILFTTQASGGDDCLGIRYDRNGAFGGGINAIKASIKTTTGYAQIESSSYVQTTGWQHLAITWQDDPNDSRLKLYINGNLNALRYDSGPVFGVITSIEKLMLGCGTMNRYWDGLLDDVRIYNRALNPAEINNIKDGAVVSGLILYWKLDESGSSVNITASPAKTAVNIFSEYGDIKKWGQATGAFYKNIVRR